MLKYAGSTSTREREKGLEVLVAVVQQRGEKMKVGELETRLQCSTQGWQQSQKGNYGSNHLIISEKDPIFKLSLQGCMGARSNFGNF